MAATLNLEPLDRALLSLEGLSVGDAFGEALFFDPLPDAEQKAPWPVTDDTLMAIDIVETLATHNRIPEAALAHRFARSFDPFRGYGPATQGVLARLLLTEGQSWNTDARSLFNGEGSMGNGAAMRIAPLGAFFATDFAALRTAVIAATLPTHTHPEALAGALAIALAAAFITQWSTTPTPPEPQDLLTSVRDYLPPGAIRSGLDRALSFTPGISPRRVGALLGSGGHTSCPDTVPFCLWSAATSLTSYSEALSRTASAHGDIDTTCAIVGGLVILHTGLASIPPLWHAHREPLAALLTPPLRHRLSTLASTP